MSIRQKQYCDICEQEHGEGSPKAEIPAVKGRPAFPQISWTYFKKGLQILKDPAGKPHLQKNWLGSANRLEFCEHHAKRFNTLLKGFCSDHSDLSKLLDKMQVEDDESWDHKQKKLQMDYDQMTKAPNTGKGVK